ncbi:hypothetical protein L208DRAFT_1382554 [Tricholoma matsutake]|nr:hypothetical protein L208DRAFT_1382554 [Tricholoma matsutake 945]
MDMDAEDGEGEDRWEDDGIDVDGADTPKKKKVKRNNGAVAVVAAGGRGPRTDQQLAGIHDERQANCAVKLHNLGQRPQNMLAKAGGQSSYSDKNAKTSVFWQEEGGGKTNR